MIVASVPPTTDNCGVESSHIYQVAFEENPIGIVLSDAQGRITRVNRQFERILGLSSSELAGRKLEDLYLHRVGAGAQPGREAMTGPDHRTFHQDCLARDGCRVSLKLTATALGAADGPGGFMTTVEVVEVEMVRREFDLDHILKSAPIMLTTCDLNGIITLCLPGSFASALDPSQVVGLAVWDLADEPDLARKAFKAVIVGGGGGTIVTHFGGRSFESHYHPALDEGGNLHSITAVVIDVTDREALAEEYRHLSLLYRFTEPRAAQPPQHSYRVQ